MNRNESLSDEDLGNNLTNKEHGSISAISERYLDSLYDFALRTSLDPAIAASSVVATMRRAIETPDSFSRLGLGPWLYGLTRDEVLEHSRTRGTGNGEQAAVLPPSDPQFSRPEGGLASVD